VFLLSEHEQHLEGAMLRTGWSLRRFYRGRGTVGRVWRHLLATPYDASIWGVINDMKTEAATAAEVASIDDTLALVDPQWADRDNLNRAARAVEAAGDVEEVD
jgi:hypothetical protein